MPHVAIESGLLRHNVTLRTRTPGVDAIGGPIVTDSDSAGTYPAYVSTVSGREFERSGLTVGEATHFVAMRYLPATAALTNTDALVFNGRVLEIEAIDNVGEENVRINFLCKEKR